MNPNFKSYEDFQDSSSYLRRKSPKFFKIFIWCVVSILIISIISLFFIKKANYIKGDAILSPKDEPYNVISPENGIVKKLNIKSSSNVSKRNTIMKIDTNNDNAKHNDFIINKNNGKISDLKSLSENISTYPYVYRTINFDSNIKKFELFKEKYKELYRENEKGYGVMLLKKEFQQEISEKIESLVDEVDSIDANKKEKVINMVSNKSGIVHIDERIKEGLEVKKGELLFQIYQGKPKNLKVHVTDSDMILLKRGLKVNIKLKSGDTTIKSKGIVKELSYFPDSDTNTRSKNQITYTVTINLDQSNLEEFDQMAITSGKAYIELGKESLAEYLYKKIAK